MAKSQLSVGLLLPKQTRSLRKSFLFDHRNVRDPRPHQPCKDTHKIAPEARRAAVKLRARALRVCLRSLPVLAQAQRRLFNTRCAHPRCTGSLISLAFPTNDPVKGKRDRSVRSVVLRIDTFTLRDSSRVDPAPAARGDDSPLHAGRYRRRNYCTR